METNRVGLLGLILVLLAVVVCCLADAKDLFSNSAEADKGREKGDQVDELNESIGDDLNKNKRDGQSGSEDKGNNQTNEGTGDDLNTNKTDGQSESKDVPTEKNDRGDPTLQKEGPRVEECDPSNRCLDKKKKLVACLRVPGNDSPHLLLLIQNKGKGPLSVTISAPDSVQLENAKVQLEEKEDKKVKVSIPRGGSDNLIVLTADNGPCKLDIEKSMAHYFQKESGGSSDKSTIAVLSLTAVLILASGWMCISFLKKLLSNNGSEYQRLEMQLPVSSGVKTESEVDYGFDNGYGYEWDDERVIFKKIFW